MNFVILAIALMGEMPVKNWVYPGGAVVPAPADSKCHGRLWDRERNHELLDKLAKLYDPAPYPLASQPKAQPRTEMSQDYWIAVPVPLHQSDVAGHMLIPIPGGKDEVTRLLNDANAQIDKLMALRAKQPPRSPDRHWDLHLPGGRSLTIDLSWHVRVNGESRP